MERKILNICETRLCRVVENRSATEPPMHQGASEGELLYSVGTEKVKLNDGETSEGFLFETAWGL